MSYMLQNGVLRTKDAAPEGTLENLKVVTFVAGSERFQEHPECSICLAPFGDADEIRLTSCDHVFHSRCLKNWFKVNHTCPLCRSSLARCSAEEGPSGGAPAAVPIPSLHVEHLAAVDERGAAPGPTASAAPEQVQQWSGRPQQECSEPQLYGRQSAEAAVQYHG